MKKHLFFLICLCILSGHIRPITYGYSDKEMEVPKLIQILLEKKGISVEELKSNPQLIKQWKQDLYQLRSKQMRPKQMLGLPQRNFGRLPSDSYYQVIIDYNIFRPLGYKKNQWTLKLELIGTITYADPSKNKAIILSNHPKHRRLNVKVGDTFLEHTVTRIETRKVSYTDKNGKEVHLNLPSLFGGGTVSPETEEK